MTETTKNKSEQIVAENATVGTQGMIDVLANPLTEKQLEEFWSHHGTECDDEDVARAAGIAVAEAMVGVLRSTAVDMTQAHALDSDYAEGVMYALNKASKLLEEVIAVAKEVSK